MRWLRLLAATLVSLGLLLLALRDVDLTRVAAVVARATPGPLLLAVALDGIVFLIKAAKWRFVFAPVRRLPVSAFFAGISVGALASTLLPFRLDELVRAAWFGRRTGIRRTTVLGTILVERLIDATVLLAGSVLVLVLLGGDGALPAAAAFPLAAALAAGAGALALVARGADLQPWLLRLPARAAATAGSLLAGLRDGLATFPRRRRLWGVSAFGAAEWLVTVAYMQAVLAAFRVDLPWAGDLALVAAGYLSFALPSAPGALGVFEFVVKGTLAAGFALPPDQALAIAVTLHALLLAPICLVGAAVVMREGAWPWQLAAHEAPGAGS